ncbi:lactate utilization protein [Neopoerus faecalis]|jgi:L-lactate utilization protein LutB|uniref:lactate utilization protein n=1 Tax=Neopoerus faecalis TaxID=3032125 RepID=UPI002570FEFB|nr:lactate utilization protein [Neopoerus faecalis]
MTDFSRVKQNLEARGFRVSVFATAAEAADYLDSAIDNTSVGFGGSVTLEQMGLYERLERHDRVNWHWRPTVDGADARQAAMTAEHYITSVNGLAETGELINIDGTGNRVASTLYGHKKVWFVVGRNKLAPTYEEALWRARNIAAPKNAQRLKRKTPCAVKADHCYDCKSPERICRGLVVLWEAIGSMEMEVVLVDEALGY